MSATSQRASILIVDDSRTVRAAINKVLSPNFEVIQAEDGEDGWEKLKQHPEVKMVISDIMMPNLDGYGLICRIRASDHAGIREVPIVVVTSAEDDITRERAHACGANDFIVKPVESSDLIERANFHTEAKLGNAPSGAPQMPQFEEVEATVIEAPDINSALEIIRGAKQGSVEPYAVDLCIEMIPLLEYCDTTFGFGLIDEIERIKKKLHDF